MIIRDNENSFVGSLNSIYWYSKEINECIKCLNIHCIFPNKTKYLNLKESPSNQIVWIQETWLSFVWTSYGKSKCKKSFGSCFLSDLDYMQIRLFELDWNELWILSRGAKVQEISGFLNLNNQIKSTSTNQSKKSQRNKLIPENKENVDYEYSQVIHIYIADLNREQISRATIIESYTSFFQQFQFFFSFRYFEYINISKWPKSVYCLSLLSASFR